MSHNLKNARNDKKENMEDIKVAKFEVHLALKNNIFMMVWGLLESMTLLSNTISLKSSKFCENSNCHSNLIVNATASVCYFQYALLIPGQLTRAYNC